MQSELKPCPFCGSEKHMLLSPTCDRSTPYNPADRAFPLVRCGGCYTDVPGKDFDASGKSAVEAWNRRAGIPEDTASDDVLGYVLRYGGMCRDCADMDGVCQSGQPCDTEQRRAVIKHTIAALAYGIKHGFIANPFASPPLSREGEDSADASFMTLVSRYGDAPTQEGFDQIYRRYLSDCERAATRSGSATTQIGSDHG